YTQAGSTPDMFIRALFDDLRGREPTRAEVRDWRRRLEAQRREEVALQLLRDASVTPPPNLADADYFAEFRRAVHRLTDKLEHLSEDCVDELEGRSEGDVSRRVEAVLNDLNTFRRVAQPGLPRDRMERAFRQFDASLEDLLQAVRRLAPDRRALLRS